MIAIPPLENGDHLTRAEFERRYELMPSIKKAELIEGIVYMPSPVRATHSEAHAHVLGWLAVYCAATPPVRLGDNAMVRLDVDNEVQPDALLRLDPTHGGRSRISEDDYIEGAPELIVEIAASSASYDLHQKLSVYRRNQVQEYIAWQVHDRRIDWYRWREGEYARLTLNDEGIVGSEVFPGLWLHVEAMLNGDLAKVLGELQKGLASAEHETLVQKLRASRTV